MKWANLKLFVRSLSRNKLYSGITIVGFSVALTFVVLLSVYLRKELAVDKFHVNKERIFRLSNENNYGYSGPVGPRLQEMYPEVECFTRFTMADGFGQVNESEKFKMKYAFVDPAFFRMFSFPLLEGSPEEVMSERYSVVLSRSFARELFGNASPLGKELKVDGHVPLKVTGVMEDLPGDTHFAPFDAAVNIAGLSKFWSWQDGDVLDAWGISTFGLYVMGKNGTDLSVKAEAMLADFKECYPMYKENNVKELKLIPLEDVYFSSVGSPGLRSNSKTLVGVLLGIVAMILMLAVINYINLSVAQGGLRSKEVTMRQLLGSSRRMLFTQFISESLLLCSFAFVIACLLSVLLEPVFNQLMGAHIRMADAFSPEMLLAALALVGVIGFVSGAVPAWMITSWRAVDVMKGAFRTRSRGVYGKALICFQYVVAIALMICTVVLVKQTRFMLNYDLGFNKECVARFSYVLDAEQREMLRGEVMKLAGVKEVAFVLGDPVDGGSNHTFKHEGKELSFQTFKVDSSFFRMMGLTVTPTGVPDGNWGSYSLWSMRNGKGAAQIVLQERSVWLNEEAVRQLGLGDLPTEFKMNGKMTKHVQGVVKDFHFRALSVAMEPVLMEPLQAGMTPWTMLVQFHKGSVNSAFKEVQQVYKKLSGNMPFESGFMEDEIALWYEGTERISAMIAFLCLLATLLSGMGILAMATYFIRQRVKEIGIRRVNGATVKEVLRMLMNHFMKWVVVAFVVACPLGYYVMQRWLSDFAYRTTMDWWIFAASGLFALLVAGMMIGWQSLKAATANPVESLKSE